VHSTEGIGTTIDIYLPITEQEVVPGSVREPRAEGGAESVLVVEDEGRLRAGIARILEGHGYSVMVAANAQEAIDLLDCDAVHVDLVVSDVVMPKMSGPNMVAEMQRRFGLDAIRVVYMSGYSASEHDLGSAPVLRKPFSEEALLRAVRVKLDE
jgi:CheY-like chemotaxis protein